MPHSDTTSLTSALASSALRAIAHARQVHDTEIARIHARHLDGLRRAAADLLASKPDPATWTAQDHHTFMLATDTRHAAAVSTSPRIPAAGNPRPTAAKPAHDSEIPF